MIPFASVTSDRSRPDVASISSGDADEPVGASAGAPALVASRQLDACLCQVDELVARFDAAAYATSLEGIFGGSIGGHVRHCLDHVRVLVETLERADQGPVPGDAPADYDTRSRGTDVETDPGAARAQLADLRDRLEQGARLPLDHPVSLSIMLSGDGLRIPMCSTVGREVAFVFSHTIHHQAMIGGMARHLGVEVPAEFGRAPSTIAHDGAGACAQ